jgi:SAM-dependent methyltransferase
MSNFDASAGTLLLHATAAYYRERYLRFGDTALGMDWKDTDSQQLRFERLLQFVDSGRPASILDVGCGNGELLAFARSRGIAVRYLGIDICAEMVAACRRRHGEDSALLAGTHDLDRLAGSFDYVVASGVFNVKQDAAVEVWEEYLFAALSAMFARCRVGVVFNVLTTRAEIRRPHLYYLVPATVEVLARHCGARDHAVDQSYPLFELTAALWKL